jgi:hypothetical protein
MVHARVGGGGIRTCDFRFIKRDSQPIELPLGDIHGSSLGSLVCYMGFSVPCMHCCSYVGDS